MKDQRDSWREGLWACWGGSRSSKAPGVPQTFRQRRSMAPCHMQLAGVASLVPSRRDAAASVV